ncbi:hypothetical protein DXP70_08000 [Listeria monocytogenes]|nr:hypothetical protein [Listeria monocytogenes]MCX67239.1 hypothetical protein [Listeria monocytogenes]MDB03002.1 hypothetical protein [Listeria monocytogenes]MDB35346.1 hypothetical protein [Listeria monocytogenes]
MGIKTFTFDESELKVPIKINDKEYTADVSAAARIKYLTIFEQVPQMIANVLVPVTEGVDNEEELAEKQAVIANELSEMILDKEDKLLSVYFNDETLKEVNAGTLPPEVYDALVKYLGDILFSNDSDGDEDEEGSGK